MPLDFLYRKKESSSISIRTMVFNITALSQKFERAQWQWHFSSTSISPMLSQTIKKWGQTAVQYLSPRVQHRIPLGKKVLPCTAVMHFMTWTLINLVLCGSLRSFLHLSSAEHCTVCPVLGELQKGFGRPSHGTHSNAFVWRRPCM